MPEQFQLLVNNLAALGVKRLAAMVIATAMVFATIGAAAYYLNRPAYETLYVGLERGDVNRIGIVLADAGIPYDIDSSGSSVLVPVGNSSLARMILAEKGLPTSNGAGYELFDNLGSLGLTSFMQEVTRVRALEGEIARSIQTIGGVKAARVHIVMSDRASFRRQEQKPTASVIVRSNGANNTGIAYSIRHLVAAAVPGLSADNVTVLDANGQLLAAGEDPMNNMLTSNVGIEQMIEKQIGDNIIRALTPYLGADNFRASIRADINTDRQQIEETIYDPDSRIERSVQVVKSEESANQESAVDPTTVEQNLPEDVQADTGGPQSSETSERREETTNYELSSKRIATVSNGYTVRKMSISVVVNRQRLVEVLGANPAPDAVAERLKEIEKVVATTAGFDEARGDAINVTAVEFLDGIGSEAAPAAGMMEKAGRHIGTVINAIAFIAVAVIVVFVGVKPLTRAIGSMTVNPATAAAVSGGAAPRIGAQAGGEARAADNPMEELTSPESVESLPFAESVEEDTANILSRMKQLPQERLEAIVDLDDERTAQVLRRWAIEEAA